MTAVSYVVYIYAPSGKLIFHDVFDTEEAANAQVKAFVSDAKGLNTMLRAMNETQSFVNVRIGAYGSKTFILPIE